MDVRMPEVDGVEATRRICSSGVGPVAARIARAPSPTRRSLVVSVLESGEPQHGDRAGRQDDGVDGS
jgi:CheY-like chemotaxis protein